MTRSTPKQIADYYKNRNRPHRHVALQLRTAGSSMILVEVRQAWLRDYLKDTGGTVAMCMRHVTRRDLRVPDLNSTDDPESTRGVKVHMDDGWCPQRVEQIPVDQTDPGRRVYDKYGRSSAGKDSTRSETFQAMHGRVTCEDCLVLFDAWVEASPSDGYLAWIERERDRFVGVALYPEILDRSGASKLWRCRDGQLMHPRAMETSHLHNAINMLIRAAQPNNRGTVVKATSKGAYWAEVLLAEIERRGDSSTEAVEVLRKYVKNLAGIVAALHRSGVRPGPDLQDSLDWGE